MADEIENIAGKDCFVFTGNRTAIWHRKGTQIPADLGAQQVMEAANLDWTVRQEPLFATIDGRQIDTNHTALIRSSDEKVLDVVTKSWHPVQNAEAFEFFHDFVEAGDMQMDTAGSLKGGKMVWALAKINSGFTLFGEDVIEGYLLFSNPHQFGRCVDIKFTPVRVVCNNTLSYALSQVSQNQVRRNHRQPFNADQAKDVLGMAASKMDDYKDQAAFLGSKRYTDEAVTDYFKRIFPVLTTKGDRSTKEISKQAQRALEILDTQPGAEFAPGSFWNAFNAVTYITTNEYGKTDDSRLSSVWFGTNASRNQKAMELALEMANA